MSSSGANSSVSPVRRVVDPLTGRSRFQFIVDVGITKSVEQDIASDLPAATHNSTIVPTSCKDNNMGTTESREASSAESSPAFPGADTTDTKAEETTIVIPDKLDIRVLDLYSRDGDAVPLRSCLKKACALVEPEPEPEREPEPEPEPAVTLPVEFDAPSVLVTAGSTTGKKSKNKSKKKNKGEPEAEEPARESRIKWGHVFVRYHTRCVGGSGGIPEYSGVEWTLGMSDTIVLPKSASTSTSASAAMSKRGEREDASSTVVTPQHATSINPSTTHFDSLKFRTSEVEDSDSEGETELNEAGVAALAGPAGIAGFSPRLGGKKGAGGSPKASKLSTKSMKIPEMAPLELTPAAVTPSAGKKRRTIAGWAVDCGSVEEVEALRQAELEVRFRILSEKEKNIFKVPQPFETRQLSHRKLPSEIGGNPLFRPLADRQRVELYTREGIDTKSADAMKRNAREARILDAIHKSREKVACQCHNLQAAEIKKWTVKRLHLELQSRSLDPSGSRQEMVDRLVQYSAAIPTCKDERSDLSLYEPDVVPGAQGPFVLQPLDAVVRAERLSKDVMLENIQYFYGISLTPVRKDAVATSVGKLQVTEGLIGESLCPCAAAGIGCIEECRCRKYGCGNRQPLDNTAYAYDSESVREIIAEVLSRCRRAHDYFISGADMEEIRQAIHAKLLKKVLATKAAAEVAAANAPCDHGHEHSHGDGEGSFHSVEEPSAAGDDEVKVDESAVPIECAAGDDIVVSPDGDTEHAAVLEEPHTLEHDEDADVVECAPATMDSTQASEVVSDRKLSHAGARSKPQPRPERKPKHMTQGSSWSADAFADALAAKLAETLAAKATVHSETPVLAKDASACTGQVINTSANRHRGRGGGRGRGRGRAEGGGVEHGTGDMPAKSPASIDAVELDAPDSHRDRPVQHGRFRGRGRGRANFGGMEHEADGVPAKVSAAMDGLEPDAHRDRPVQHGRFRGRGRGRGGYRNDVGLSEGTGGGYQHYSTTQPLRHG